MINRQLLHPESIVVIGGSNDIAKPGGKVLKNLIDAGFKGKLYVTNPKESEVQGVKSFASANLLPDVDMAIIAIAAKFIPDVVEVLTKQKNTRAFIVFSAGFSEESEEGKKLEKRLVSLIDAVGGALIGPNCIGVLTPDYAGVFTTPVPKLDASGCDFVSGSGSTAVFIMESGIPKGLSFASVFSVGNSPQIGVEEVLQYWDEHFDPQHSSRIKMLYIENINKPALLLKHATSLIRKGCKIAAIKAGSSEAGSRAAASHTGALVSPDVAVDALLRKAGIVRCYGRDELTTVAAIFMHKELTGKRLAIITHAGGPAVMLTDALSNGGMDIPHLEGPDAKELATKLFPASSVGNPIDFLATGTAQQLGTILDYCEHKFTNIDAMVVIFGNPGLFEIFDVYKLLDEKMRACKKPIYPVLPSLLTAEREIKYFLSLGRLNFPDEVVLGNALVKVYHTPKPAPEKITQPEVNNTAIRSLLAGVQDGFLPPDKIQKLLDACGIPRAEEAIVTTAEDARKQAARLGYPLAMKVVGPLHKSDVGGVVLHVQDADTVVKEFTRMMQIPNTTAVMLQPMLTGTELFVGAKWEDKFGHIVLSGLGGIWVEVFKDVSVRLAPVSSEDALSMIRSLKGYKIIQGVRGQEGVDENKFADILVRVSALLAAAPEITELDLNPLLGNRQKVVAVDARIRVVTGRH